MKKVEGGVTAAEGFQAASTAAGIKYKNACTAASDMSISRKKKYNISK